MIVTFMGDTTNKIKGIHTTRKRQQALALTAAGDASNDAPDNAPQDVVPKVGKAKAKVCPCRLYLFPFNTLI